MAQRDEDLGARVRAARSYAGLSQSGLADAIGVERRIVTYIEANDSRHPLSVREAHRIADATGVPVGFLLNGWDGTAGLAERIDALERQISSGEEDRGDLARQVDELSVSLETLTAAVEGRFATLATEVLQQVIALLREQGPPGGT